MEIATTSKELIELIRTNSKSKQFIKKVCKIIQVIISLIIVSIYLHKFLKCNIDYSGMVFNLWDERLREFLHSEIVFVIIVRVVYDILIARVLWFIIYYIFKIKEDCVIPILISIDDCVNVIFSIYYAGYGINNLIEQVNGIYNNDKIITYIAILYLTILCIQWIYIKNRNDWYECNKKYTDYYDRNNNRIPDKAYVNYKGKRWYVYCTQDILGGKDDMIKAQWRIRTCGFDKSESMLLEEAVQDIDWDLILDNEECLSDLRSYEVSEGKI